MSRFSLTFDRKIRQIMIYSFVFLIYLFIPIHTLFHKSIFEMWIGFSTLALFGMIYLLCYLNSSRRLLYVIGLIVIIGFLCLRYNDSFILMGFYTAFIVGMLSDNKQFITAMTAQLGLLILALLYRGLGLNESDIINALPSALVMTVMPVIMRGNFRSNGSGLLVKGFARTRACSRTAEYIQGRKGHQSCTFYFFMGSGKSVNGTGAGGAEAGSRGVIGK
ncbi:hypothetical protein NSU08_41310 [Paenibacillus sp. FSL H7-0331]|uniref:hypothetical protein n=1 Tax=Paenibacillus sp. FSL H7-0331 TaxID=1920421 RepID=UPI00097A12E0|nr:hypothetical protein [Paenibacillus sp. FSL H7-0331]OMF03910.1 hypothetical protein BK127_34835 [Paenibacillus sp. FSL H7-0331]